MAHPKSRISKQRKRKRRTHKTNAGTMTLSTCPTTGVTHRRHRAYYVEGNLYYKGQMVVKNEENLED